MNNKPSLEYLNKHINDTIIDSYSHQYVSTGFDLSPNDFLLFAEYDLEAEYKHHLVNSLSNTKRAIDSQLDALLIGFGISKRAKNWNFPTKIDFMNNIGIISPRILNKINKKRNLLEHEFKNPNKEEVEDALDVTNLFINYTNKYLSPALVECYLITDNNGFEISLDWMNCKILFSCGRKNDLKIELSSDQPEYDAYLKYYIKLYDILHRYVALSSPNL